MRPAPTNRNVSINVWERDMGIYSQYKRAYDHLRASGLTDEAADRYIDAFDKAFVLLQQLDPQDSEFVCDDHTEQLTRCIAALTVMQETLKEA